MQISQLQSSHVKFKTLEDLTTYLKGVVSAVNTARDKESTVIQSYHENAQNYALTALLYPQSFNAGLGSWLLEQSKLHSAHSIQARKAADHQKATKRYLDDVVWKICLYVINETRMEEVKASTKAAERLELWQRVQKVMHQVSGLSSDARIVF